MPGLYLPGGCAAQREAQHRRRGRFVGRPAPSARSSHGTKNTRRVPIHEPGPTDDSDTIDLDNPDPGPDRIPEDDPVEDIREETEERELTAHTSRNFPCPDLIAGVDNIVDRLFKTSFRSVDCL